MRWEIFDEAIEMSKAQIDRYTGVYDDNRRPLQPLHGRRPALGGGPTAARGDDRERRDALAGKAPHHETGRFVQFGSEEDDMSLKLVITLLVAASLLGGAMGAGVALVVDNGKVGPRGPQGEKGPPGPPGIYADVGVLEARIAGLDRRLSRLERR